MSLLPGGWRKTAHIGPQAHETAIHIVSAVRIIPDAKNARCEHVMLAAYPGHTVGIP